MKEGKINIAYISHFPHYKMGGQKSMLALIENLDRNIFRPYVILPKEGELSRKLNDLNCTVQFLPLTSLKPKNINTVFSNIFAIRKFIKQEHIDILHPDFERDAFVAGLAKLNTQAKMIWHVRLTRPERLDKINARLADGIIGVSSAVKKRFSEVKDIDKKYITVFNGVDCTLFKPAKNKISLRESLGIPLNRPIVLFVGQIKDSKGIEDILNASDLINKKNLAVSPLFLLVGDYESSNYEAYITGIINSRNLSSLVNHKQQQNNIQDWMVAADMLVLPSYEGSEGMGRVIFEAMACGTVPIGTNISGINEAISNDTGILIPQHSPAKLVDAILQLISDKSLYETLSINSRKRAETVFDIKIHTEKVQNFYQNIFKK